MQTVQDVIDLLKTVPPHTKVVGMKFIPRWSGNPDDTDLSEEVQYPLEIDVRPNKVIFRGE